MSVTFYYDFKDLQWFFAFFQLFFISNMMTRSMHAARGLCNFTTSSRVSFGKPHAADERRQRWRSRWGCSLWTEQSGPIQPTWFDFISWRFPWASQAKRAHPACGPAWTGGDDLTTFWNKLSQMWPKFF